MSTSYPHKIDHRIYCATQSEEDYGVALDVADMNREFSIGESEPTDRPKRTGYSPCGGEFHTNTTDEQWDAELAISAIATPDLTGWLLKYVFGGKGAYSVAGSANPWTHTYKPLGPPDYQNDSATILSRYKGSSDYYRFRGGLMADWKLGASIDGEKRFKHEGKMEFAGEREPVVIASPPACVPEDPYRITSSVISIGPYGDDPWTTKTPRLFEVSIGNALVGVDEADRDGLYIAGRDRGPRTELFRMRYHVLGRRGDDFDQAYHEGDEITLSAVLNNKTTGRVLTVYGTKLVITKMDRGYSTSAGISTHELDLLGLLDPTSTATEAKSPFWATLQSGTASY